MPRGFTLVELMIVVAVIGVLAALAIGGVRRYLTAAKSVEAKNSVGAISRAAQAAFVRESIASQNVAEGSHSNKVSHVLCASASPVPAAVPDGHKYQPVTVDGFDFNSGDDVTGWRCLNFTLTQPIYYQYHYTRGSSPAAPLNPSACTGACYEAGALGDLNGNGIPSRLARTGHVNTASGTLRASTQIYVDSDSE